MLPDVPDVEAVVLGRTGMLGDSLVASGTLDESYTSWFKAKQKTPTCICRPRER